MVMLNENIVGLDSAIFMHPTIWKASGHVDAFNDPLIDNKEMAEIVRNYLNKFNNVELKILNLEQKMINLFEDLRGVLNDHFTQRHAEVVEGIADLQAQITENVRRNNDSSTEFFKKYAGVLEWALIQKEQHDRRSKKSV